jgi:hypothetical protein
VSVFENLASTFGLGLGSRGASGGLNPFVVFEGLTKLQAHGIEQAVIELNNGKQPYPYHNTKTDNIKYSTAPYQKLKYEMRKLAGEA